MSCGRCSSGSRSALPHRSRASSCREVRPLKIHVLASGSKGNAVVVEDGEHRLLVDAGLSARELERRLKLVGCWPPCRLQGLLLTHEHSDHVRGARLFARRHGIPVFATAGTFAGLDEGASAELGPLWSDISHGLPVTVPGCGLGVVPVSVEHDTRCPVGFVFTSACGRYRAGVVTDLGHAGLVARELAGCHLLVLEFNHDVALLRANRKYPRELKERILGNVGHLSNEQAAQLLRKIFHLAGEPRLQALVLAHLSEQNNTPELALREARAILGSFRLEAAVEVKVAGPAEPVTVGIRR